MKTHDENQREMSKLALILLALFMATMVACSKGGGASSTQAGLSCRGYYTTTTAQGKLQAWDQHPNTQGTACLTDSVPLTQWQDSLQARTMAQVRCTPQPVDLSLSAHGNYYQYRDGKELIDLDGSTGTYRRVYLGVGKDGSSQFTREMGCFFTRQDATYGLQILFDSTNAASTEYTVPTEIYRMDQAGTSWLLTRNDDTSDWGAYFCPDLSTPDQYCAALRNGNYMYEPSLDSATAAALTSEAVLIRTKFSYTQSTHSQFMSLWNSLDSTTMTEAISSGWQYQVKQVVDTPAYIDPSWQAYIKYQSDLMPDVTSPEALPICYSGKEPVTLSNGQVGSVYGQICYVDGSYNFIGGQ